MTLTDTIDLIVSGALWLRVQWLHESDALDIVHRTYVTTSVRAAKAGWSCRAARVLADRRGGWQARGAR